MVVPAYPDRAVSIAPEIALSGISRRFGSVAALADVDLTLRPGRVHALLGENGAGKSTLMGVAFGLLQPDRGRVCVAGIPTLLRSPRDALRLGIGMVHQHFSLVPALTVAENVALGGRGVFRPAAAADRVRRVAAAAGLDVDPSPCVRDLSVEAQQRVEIVRALAHGARVLILDEPTAVLAPEESAVLLTWIRRFAADGGAVAIVTHKVNEALAVADDVTVLRAGRCVSTGPVRDSSAPSLAQAMFPNAPLERQVVRKAGSVHGPVVASAHHLSLPGRGRGTSVVDATLEIRAGEVLGVVGVEGAGHAELLRSLAGLIAPSEGQLRIPDTVSFVPADRHRDALILEFPLFENLALRRAGFRRGLMDWPALREKTRGVLAEFGVRADSERTTARALSGGNQQRFVLGRELEPRPALLVAENPTRGLDLHATASIHARLRAAADAGAAVVIYSSDLDEVITLADRVLVVHDGAVREVGGGRETIARAMVGDW